MKTGDLRESVQDMSLKHYGTLTQNYRSTVPFNPESRLHLDQMSRNFGRTVDLSEGKNVQGEWNTFDGTSYNYVAAGRQSDFAFEQNTLHIGLCKRSTVDSNRSDYFTLPSCRYYGAGPFGDGHSCFGFGKSV